LQKNGFEVKIYEKNGGLVEVITQMWNLFIPIFILPANILGSVPSVILPGNKDIYLNAVIVAKKVC
jgi:hypothetical protein